MRLESFGRLSDAEKSTLRAAVNSPRRHSTSQISITATGPANDAIVIMEGFACRYKIFGAGRRQILGYLIPGDICGLRLSTLKRRDYCIGTFGPAETATLSSQRILGCSEHYPNLARGLWCSMLAEEFLAREWITNVGQRSAYERVAHLFCELFLRLQRVQLTQDNRCTLPLTQRDLADALSLSSVHVNRVLQQMRLDGLVSFRQGQLVLKDADALRNAAGFDPAYLELGARTKN